MPRSLFLLLLAAIPAFAQYTPVSGWCQNGGQSVVTVGVPNSTTKVQRSYLGCTVTVTVYNGGAATIYSDSTGTAKANPFTGSTTDGTWSFFAAPGIFTVTLSGGGIAAPFSQNVTVAAASAVGTGTVTSVATTTPITGGTITTTGTIACATCVTAAAALTSNQLILGGGSQATAALGALGTTTTLLHGNAAGAPSFGAVALAADVSGTLPIANGGTGQSTQTTAFNALSPLTTRGDTLYFNGTNNIRKALGTNGQVLTSDGTDANWTALPAQAGPISAATTNAIVTAASATTIQTNTNAPTTDGSGNFTSIAKISGKSYGTATNCTSSASPAVCGSAAAGSVVIAAAATTVVVNTTAVTANSQIFVMADSSLGTKLSVTCNTNIATQAFISVSARSAGVSFTITISGSLSTNPGCLSFFIEN